MTRASKGRKTRTIVSQKICGDKPRRLTQCIEVARDLDETCGDNGAVQG